jgi:ABC-type Mn2+/Zn2+ transport system permease subunit
MFSSHLEGIIVFAGFFFIVFAMCLCAMFEAKDKEERKDIAFAWVTLDGMFAVGVGIVAFFGWQTGHLFT